MRGGACSSSIVDLSHHSDEIAAATDFLFQGF
jgi:hypothetical protein